MMLNLRRMAERLVRNQILRRKFPKRFGRRPIWVSPDARLRYCKLGSGAFDKELLDIAERYTRAGDFILDLGGNVGEFSLAAAHRVGQQGGVLAVEPDPFLGSLLLRTTMEPENADLRFKLLSGAVSSEVGLSWFHISARGRASNALAACGVEDMGGKRHELLTATTTVDTIVSHWHPPTFLKIDVEGAECFVLTGAKSTLLNHRPLILIEVRKNEQAIKEILLDFKYAFYNPLDLELRCPLDKCAYNTLVVPSELVSQVRRKNEGLRH